MLQLNISVRMYNYSNCCSSDVQSFAELLEQEEKNKNAARNPEGDEKPKDNGESSKDESGDDKQSEPPAKKDKPDNEEMDLD